MTDETQAPETQEAPKEDVSELTSLNLLMMSLKKSLLGEENSKQKPRNLKRKKMLAGETGGHIEKELKKRLLKNTLIR